MKKDLLGISGASLIISKVLSTSMTLHGKSASFQHIVDQPPTTASYVISILLCSLTLIVVAVLIVGLALGTIGFRKNTKPPERKWLSNLGGLTLIYL